ncbi:hypothetical protein [Thauera aromatica]|uniref:Uncharacterized protein n=1 Tax=Thauera aromatica K172 TaxID=44139 RepID=A0A2R4BNY8_THAAR|nr:hypothetical protein [Thauera aromatica]AVR89051.1 hypothetical protein Tharo_2148 [Thauera aromatica K172]
MNRDQIETGGPAFPMQEPQAIHAYAVAAVEGITDPDERDRAYLKARGEAVGGMSLRDYFAAKAMQGFAADSDTAWGDGVNGVARTAYEWADAMLRARRA